MKLLYACPSRWFITRKYPLKNNFRSQEIQIYSSAYTERDWLICCFYPTGLLFLRCEKYRYIYIKSQQSTNYRFSKLMSKSYILRLMFLFSFCPSILSIDIIARIPAVTKILRDYEVLNILRGKTILN